MRAWTGKKRGYQFCDDFDDNNNNNHNHNNNNNNNNNNDNKLKVRTLCGTKKFKDFSRTAHFPFFEDSIQC